MIRNIRFHNFYSFKKEQEISFLTKKKSGYDYFNSKSNFQITKIAGFVGANASGKTNIMRLFSFMGYFACRSSIENTPSDLQNAYKKFFYNDEPSGFKVEFELADSIYFYEFSLQKTIIIDETLYVQKMIKGSRKVEIYSRKLNEIKVLNKNYFENFPIKFLKNIRSDISLLSFLKSHYNIEIINKVFNYFNHIKTNINEAGQLNNPQNQIANLELYLQDEEIKKEMEEFICQFDLGLKGFNIKKETIGGTQRISVSGIHQSKESNNELAFNYESRGTQSLFFTLAEILYALKNNSIVIIDEIELGFHPEALIKLISYFIEQNRNGKAQLLFSSNSLVFMNEFDMHQIYLVEKNDKGASVVYRLNTVKGIRPDENFQSKYMSGSYGAFPKIRT